MIVVSNVSADCFNKLTLGKGWLPIRYGGGIGKRLSVSLIPSCVLRNESRLRFKHAGCKSLPVSHESEGFIYRVNQMNISSYEKRRCLIRVSSFYMERYL